MFNRRKFLKTMAAGAAASAQPVTVLASRNAESVGGFGVHEFIESNPDAVFIMRTNVDVKTNSDGMKQAGMDFGRSVIVPKENGVPLSHLVPIKPNLTSSYSSSYTQEKIESTMGIVTDPHFVEGIIESMKELGLSGNQFYLREVNSPEHFGPRGYTDMAERTGADMRDLATVVWSSNSSATTLSSEYVQWIDLPEGLWYRKIPYLWPVNAPNTFYLNVAKFKTHGMGVTLCGKNIQGTMAHNYQAHCSSPNRSMDMNSTDMNPNAFADIQANFDRHLAEGVPRWDRTGSNWNCGIGMETWASRATDNHLASNVALNIIEGVYGRDGNFSAGPHMPDGSVDLNNKRGIAKDYMSNIVIFGKNAFHNDVIGHWLAGHEPGNFGLFYLSRDRGMSKYINPFSVPLYEWNNGVATRVQLDTLERTPLLTYYLQKNYGGQTENYWHMVDEPVDYTTVDVAREEVSDKPGSFVLNQNYPNPFNPYTSIEFTIPHDGHARLEVYNVSGQVIDVLVDGRLTRGSHMATFNTNGHASGTYFYRFMFGGFSEVRKMTLLK